jgi:exodeoxyribonuclease VII large subunit
VLENDYQIIGVISSLNAAGMKDFVYTLNQRCCNKTIYVYPSSVQGASAPKEIMAAIELANKHNKSQILVLIRGGGSKEDLECFNTRTIADAIFKSNIPIVTGIGHQIDTSIADLCAAKHYITPTATAQNITRENITSKNKLDELINVIHQKIIKYMNSYHEYLLHYEDKLIRYQSKFVAGLDGGTEHYYKQIDKIQKHVILSMNKYHDYITNTETETNVLLETYHCDIAKMIDMYNHNLLTSIEISGQILMKYDEQIKNLVQPRIISDETNEEITSVADLIKKKSYTICFIDGEYNLKI